MLTDFFDTMGTVTGVAAEAGLTQRGRLGPERRAASSSSTRVAAAVGGLAGVSSNTTYIESAAGVAEGGRTGFASVVTGVLFLLAIFLSPIAGIIPGVATAPALVLVGYLMFTQVKGIDVGDVEEGIPALLTMILMPLTYDITVGIGAGFISWVVIKLFRGKLSEHPPADVDRLDRLPGVLPPGLDHRHAAELGRAATADPTTGGPARPPVVRCPATIDTMFERTALAAGPRVISARLPGARSVSIAAYVLAGSRLETPEEAGRRPLHGAPHLQGHRAAYPSTRAISEAIEGVGGSFNAATDRESTVYWVRVPRREATRAMDVLGELIVRPRLEEADIDGERTVIVEEIRSYLDDPAEYAQILFQQAMFGTARSAARSAATRPGSGPCRRRRSTTSGGRSIGPANTVVAVAGDLDHGEAVDLAATAFGTGNGADPGLRPRPGPAGRRAGPPEGPPRRDPGPADRRRPGPPPRPSRRVDPGRPQRGPRRRDVEPPVPLGPRGPGPRLRRVVGARRLRRCRLARGLGRRRSRRGCRRPSTRSSSSSPACATRRSRPTSWRRRRRYLSGGLELRMDETRHLASWIGGQEALHDRVLTLDEALAAVAAVDAPTSSAWPASCSATTACASRWSRRPATLRGLERRLRLPA